MIVIVFVLLIFAEAGFAQSQELTRNEFTNVPVKSGPVSYTQAGDIGSPVTSMSIIPLHEASWWNRSFAAAPMFAGDT